MKLDFSYSVIPATCHGDLSRHLVTLKLLERRRKLEKRRRTCHADLSRRNFFVKPEALSEGGSRNPD
jgi:hypothetical protein